MIKIHRLKQPNKHSGHPLEPNKSVQLRGLTITNKNDFVVYVDKFTRKPWKPAKAATKKGMAKKASPIAKLKKVAAKKSETHASSH